MTIGFSIIQLICLVSSLLLALSVRLLCRRAFEYLQSPSWGSRRGDEPWISPTRSVPGRTPEEKQRTVKEGAREGTSSPPRDRSASLENLFGSAFPECQTPWYSHGNTKIPSKTSPEGFLLQCSASACTNHQAMTIVWTLTDLVTSQGGCQGTRIPSWCTSKARSL